MTDAETIANADLLWRLVRLVKERIGKDGTVQGELSELRRVADEALPEDGKE